MQNWQKYRNFRKQLNTDGSYTYTVTVDGEKTEVSKGVYTAYAKYGYKMEHMEFGVKCDRFLQDEKGKAVRDENGNPVMLPEREVSLDKLVDENWDYPDAEPSPEDAVLQKMEFEDLHRCLTLLDDDERMLIQALFFDGMKIREYAEFARKTKSSVDRLKTKTLDKLKKLLTS